MFAQATSKEEYKKLTLKAALREVDEHRWRGMRSRQRNYCQAEIGIATLEQIVLTKGKARFPSIVARHTFDGSTLLVGAIKKQHVLAAVLQWRCEHLEPASITVRLACLSALGIDVRGCRPKVKNALRWWLSPEQEMVLHAHLQAEETEIARHLSDFITWTTRMGLRVEESLRLRWTEVQFRENGEVAVTVPGLKTALAQSTLPLDEETAALFRRRKAQYGGQRVFEISYPQLQRAWARARIVLNLEDPKIATLKAFRRSAARSLHVAKGMPLDVLRQVLRHERMATTLGYLRLVGGYSEAEMRKWL